MWIFFFYLFFYLFFEYWAENGVDIEVDGDGDLLVLLGQLFEQNASLSFQFVLAPFAVLFALLLLAVAILFLLLLLLHSSAFRIARRLHRHKKHIQFIIKNSYFTIFFPSLNIYCLFHELAVSLLSTLWFKDQYFRVRSKFET